MIQLEASAVSVKFEGEYRLKEINLQLNKGELIGLIGPNGSGKSTLLKSISGLNTIDHGRVLLHGRDIINYGNRERGRTLGYLEQNGDIHWPLRVERLVELGRVPHLSGWAKASKHDLQHVEHALLQTDTLHLKNRIATTLSGGEKCRVLLARVLTGNPDILLADEPIAALDLAHQLMIMNSLRSFVDSGGAAIIAIHDLNLASRYCDQLALLDHGLLIMKDLPEYVITEHRLESVYGILANLDHDGDGKLTVFPYALTNKVKN